METLKKPYRLIAALLSFATPAFFTPLLFVLSTPAHASAPLIPGSTLPDLVDKILPGVVNISSTTVTNFRVQGLDEFMDHWGVPQERRSTSLGSGFLIDKDGFIITNNHVVEKATEVAVTLQDKRQFTARVVGKDQKMDLALLQIRDKDGKVPQNLQPVPMGDSEKVRIAETVFAVGNPFGLQHTVTTGIISAKNRTIGLGPFDNFLQTDASINPGNSGGPLFGLTGEVVGINTVIFSRTGQSGGLGFAIPINEAKAIIADLKKYGRVPRPWLGLLGERVTPALVQYYQLPVSSGVVVFNMVQRGPSDKGGLRQGDIIIGMDGAEITAPEDLERALYKHRPKEKAKIKVQRGRKALDLDVHLDELPRLDQLPQGII